MENFGILINALTFSNLFYCFIGCVVGTLVGVLPGLSPSATLSLLLPLTLYLDPAGSIIMLAGILYGAMYGGSTTSIVVNIPGEPASVVTCIDGFQMTKQGRAGEALWISAVGSFMAGTLGVIGISYLGPWIAKYAVKFGPPEYFGLLLFGLTMVISLAGASVLKGLVAGVVGMFLAMLGSDPLTGVARLNFGVMLLRKGLDMVPVLVGLFGMGEILSAAEQGTSTILEGKLGKKWMPRGAELKMGLWASLRGSVLGFVVGLLPGMNPILTSFFAYDFEKRISKHPEKFGTGVIEGVAGPEAANNATAMAGFIPMMSLGIPTSASTAIIMACLVLHGLQPGPMLFVQQKDFFWTVIGSMYVGNVMLLILNLPLVGLWARISLIPYKILGPIILAICFVAAYSPRRNLSDIGVAIVFGALGYFMRKRQWPIAPLILGFILGDLFEGALRQSLAIGMGSPIIFFKRPIALIFIILTGITVVLTTKFLKRVPKEVLKEEP